MIDSERLRYLKNENPKACTLNEVREMAGELERLRLQVRSSLANNLCPDHRDKQQGKPCLACEIERLRKIPVQQRPDFFLEGSD